MKLIVKALFTVGLAGLAGNVWAEAACNPASCGTNSTRVDGSPVERGAPKAADARTSAGFVVAALRTPDRPSANDRGPVAQPASFIPSWGQNLNSSIVAAASIAGTPLHAVALTAPAPALPLPVGTRIELRDAAGARYVVLVAAHGRTRFWAGSDAPVTTHVLLWTGAAPSRPQPLCTAGINEAILFAGDRYDAQRKTVIDTGGAADDVLNIGCAGTALAKLYLMRHTDASQEVPTTRAERQAMLKMLTADVYGDGRSFTGARQPLRWSDAKQITRFDARPVDVEAVWNEHGAVCLNVPRIAAEESNIAARGRRPPRCTGPDSGRLPAGYVVSAHP